MKLETLTHLLYLLYLEKEIKNVSSIMDLHIPIAKRVCNGFCRFYYGVV
jgi:hypothetical protein